MGWEMMSPNFFHRNLPILLIITYLLFGKSYDLFANTGHPTNMLDSIKTALFDPEGLELNVVWEYNFNNEKWKGDGILFLLGNDYLKLTLPYQVILIKKSTIMSYYPETDQVIIDYFDRNDNSNIFSILLGDFSGFSIVSEHNVNVTNRRVVLESNSLIGFDRIEMTLDQGDWIPKTIMGEAGKDIKIMITIVSSSLLKNPDALINGTLVGAEIIDFRE